MERLRAVLFGSGSPLSLRALETLLDQADVTLVVVPRISRRFFRTANPLASVAGAKAAELSSGTPQRIAAARPDLICVASFPSLIPPRVLSLARLGALNIHGSLLPMHRGPDPLFWTYFHDDRETGVTLHWLNDRFDAGNIVSQVRIDLPRGKRVHELYFEQARLGVSLLGEAVRNLTSGSTLPGAVQDEDSATVDPSPRPGNWRIDFATWPVERVWHFLQGLSPVYRHLVPVAYEPEFRAPVVAHGEKPGTIRIRGGELRVFCSDGWVDAPRAPLQRRIRQWLRRR